LRHPDRRLAEPRTHHDPTPGSDAIPPAPFPREGPNHFSQVPIPPNPVWIQPEEPRATTAMVLGIVAIAGGMLCLLPFMCGPVALVMGLKSLNAIKAQPHLGGHGEAMDKSSAHDKTYRPSEPNCD
jgi:hypothetical protein